MYKTKPSNTNSHSRQKKIPPKPKPQFSTDFVDRDKYKLSETEIIQKKASLQSKHREDAIRDLQERRRKLEQGIIDDDTRKVYQTALTSKKIDINPPIRKNLSQMIHYEREKQEQVRSSSRQRKRPINQRYDQNEAESEDDNNQEIQRQLRDTRDFIKKLQRVKKIDNIQKAVDILIDPVQKERKQTKISRDKETVRSKQKDKSSQKKSPLNNERILADLKESKTSGISSQQQALSSIQDTIRFMEERLFSANRIQKIKQQEISKLKDSTLVIEMKQTTFLSPQIHSKQNLQLSGLGFHQSDSEQQCLQTIRRMKDMMEGKQKPDVSSRLKENRQIISNRQIRYEQLSTLQKKSPHIADSEASVDFSLTVNQSETPSLQQSKYEIENEQRQFQRIKKGLFQEVNRLQLHTPEEYIAEPSFHTKSPLPIDQSSITNIRSMQNPTPKTKKINPQLAKLRNQIQSVRDNVDSIKVEPLTITRPGEIMGLDFRGSINIKKHIIQK